MTTIAKTRVAWVCITQAVPLILYMTGFQMYHWADMTQRDLLVVLWPHMLAVLVFGVLGLVLLGEGKHP